MSSFKYPVHAMYAPQPLQHPLRPRAASCPTVRPPPAANPDTNTIHVAYRPGVTDRGELYLYFRDYDGFDLFAFYDHYCFVRFREKGAARKALTRPAPQGVITLEAAQKNYRVPYPQPEDGNSPCKVLHITHLPTNYSKDEMCKVFRAFPGFVKAQFHGKYGYAFYESDIAASKCWMRLRDETNLVVSYAKNAKSEEEDISLMEREQRVLPIGIPRAQRLALPPRLHIPTPPYSYNATAEDFYSLLSRESIKQLDADITNDFEKLLVESHNRLYPNAFEPRYPCKAEPTLTSSSEEDETTLCSEKFEEELSLEDGFSYVSEVSSPVTHGSRTLVNSPATSPGHPEYPRTYRKASWTYTTPLSAPILHGRFLRPTFHGSDRYL